MHLVSKSSGLIYKTKGAKVVLPHTWVLVLKFHPDFKILNTLGKKKIHTWRKTIKQTNKKEKQTTSNNKTPEQTKPNKKFSP